MKVHLTLIFVFSLLLGKAQIINVEGLRLSKDTVGFSGHENLDFAVVRNTQSLFTLNNNLGLQYHTAKNEYLLFSNLTFNFSSDVNFERNGFAHLRYGRIIKPWLMLEALAQYQIDIPLRIAQRVLTGAGPRITFIRQERQKFIMGHLILYELDEELNNNNTNQNTRLSSYLVYQLAQKDKASWTTTLYYQPRLDKFEDFRISGQTQLSFTVFKKVQFIVTGSVNYDAFPVVDTQIPQLTYRITNGLRVVF